MLDSTLKFKSVKESFPGGQDWLSGLLKNSFVLFVNQFYIKIQVKLTKFQFTTQNLIKVQMCLEVAISARMLSDICKVELSIFSMDKAIKKQPMLVLGPVLINYSSLVQAFFTSTNKIFDRWKQFLISQTISLFLFSFFPKKSGNIFPRCFIALYWLFLNDS